MDNNITIFAGADIRRHWDENEEKWYFSVVDIIAALTESSNPRDYWFKMKIRVTFEDGIELSTLCQQLKMTAQDGKLRDTDCAGVEEVFRIIQSISSPKAEPFKQWLAKVGYERLQEINDPEISIDRARDNYKLHGRSNEWIQRRMMGQEVRNKLTDYWKNNEVKKGNEFAALTNIIHQEWTDLSVNDHKKLKGLKNQINFTPDKILSMYDDLTADLKR